MRFRSTRIVAIVCVLSLLGAQPAFGDDWSTATPDPTVTTPSTGTTPSDPPSTSTPPKSTTPSPSTPKATTPKTNTSPGSTSTPSTSQDSASKLPVPVDPQTKQFRDKLTDQQTRLAALKAQLAELDRQLSVAVEEYNKAAVRLAQVKRSLDNNQQDLADAQHAYEAQVRQLSERATDMYRNGDTDAIEVILASKSITDFLSRLQFLGLLGEKDAARVEQLAMQRDSIQSTTVDLKRAKAEAEALEFDLRARKIEIENRIAEQQLLMSGQQGDMLQLLQAEASRRNADEAALMQQILSGAGRAGVNVTPGSPIETALAYHGVPYLWGGETPAAFDCSGLVLYVFKQHGVTLPHYSGFQFQLGQKVAYSDLQPNDVVFFGSPIHHVGIYLGGGYYLHAPKTGDFVKVSRLSDRRDYAGARRYPWVPRLGPIAGLDKIDHSRVNPNAPGLPQ